MLTIESMTSVVLRVIAIERVHASLGDGGHLLRTPARVSVAVDTLAGVIDLEPGGRGSRYAAPCRSPGGGVSRAAVPRTRVRPS